jgi:hypothetical protein
MQCRRAVQAGCGENPSGVGFGPGLEQYGLEVRYQVAIHRDRRVLAHLEPDRCSLQARPVPPAVVEPYDWMSQWHLECVRKAAQDCSAFKTC